MTLLQKMTDKRAGSGRKSHWPKALLDRADELLAEGHTAIEVARMLDLPRGVVNHRNTVRRRAQKENEES